MSLGLYSNKSALLQRHDLDFNRWGTVATVVRLLYWSRHHMTNWGYYMHSLPFFKTICWSPTPTTSFLLTNKHTDDRKKWNQDVQIGKFSFSRKGYFPKIEMSQNSFSSQKLPGSDPLAIIKQRLHRWKWPLLTPSPVYSVIPKVFSFAGWRLNSLQPNRRKRESGGHDLVLRIHRACRNSDRGGNCGASSEGFDLDNFCKESELFCM